MSDELITQIEGEFSGGEIDPMLEAIRTAIVQAGADGDALSEFGEKQVAIVPPDETEAGINAKIETAMGKTRGLCLLLVPGSGKNPDTDAPGPLINVELEVQLYVSKRIRGRQARPVMELLTAIARLLHHAKVSLSAFDYYERIKFLGYDPLPDEEFTAFALRFERELQL